MIESNEEESFLVPVETAAQQKEKVWCKINEQNQLELVDWDTVSGLAKQFDATHPSHRTEQMLIGKLMWEVRRKTTEELQGANHA